MGIDDKKLRSINIKFPIEKSVEGGFGVNRETLDAVADDLKILILTNYGERVCLYDFGCNLRATLFENSNNLKERVKDNILYGINKFMSYITIEDIKVFDSEDSSNVDPNEIYVQIRFSVGNTDLKKDVAISLRK